MSSASYSAWAKFDVEKELLHVDEVEQHERQQMLQRKRLQAKENVETSASKAAQQSADVLAAQAAVAALKAKKRVRKGQDASDTEVIGAEKLQSQAMLCAQKASLLQEILKHRRDGDKALDDKKEAKMFYEKALTAVQRLEELAPMLLEQEQAMKKESTEIVAQEKSQECSLSGKQCLSDGKKHCHQGKETTQTRDETLPKATDLLAIIKMFYEDVYMGIGTCELHAGRLAVATEAFKEVLIRDDGHLVAWLQRGESFERMNAPLLAMLHYNRIINLNSEHEKGTEALERIKATLLSKGDAANDKLAIESMVTACMEGLTLEQVLERIQWVFEEANVLAIENFYDYSTTKYQVVLGCLQELQRQPTFTSMTIEASSLIQKIAISCHMNIASGCLEMQRNYTNGLRHCEQALELDSKYAMSHFRMGQLYHALHKYDKALQSFEAANALVPDANNNLARKHRMQMKTRIVKEIDKCKFDRNQYDLDYLRSLPLD